MKTEQINLIGYLAVGDLMSYEGYGWTFSRSGRRNWSQVDGVTKRPMGDRTDRIAALVRSGVYASAFNGCIRWALLG